MASSPHRPTNWTPIGRFSAFQCNGTDMAGWPVMLNSIVLGTGAMFSPATSARARSSNIRTGALISTFI